MQLPIFYQLSHDVKHGNLVKNKYGCLYNMFHILIIICEYKASHLNLRGKNQRHPLKWKIITAWSE